MNGIFSSPAAAIVSSRSAGSFVGEPGVDDKIRVESTRASDPWEAVTSRNRARSRASSTPRFVCGNNPRSNARSHTHTT